MIIAVMALKIDAVRHQSKLDPLRQNLQRLDQNDQNDWADIDSSKIRQEPPDGS
jgi:hypothetical protein